MKSLIERQHVNGKKYIKTEREAAELALEFLKGKYAGAYSFFWVIRQLKLLDRDRKLRAPFGYEYLADKLTQRITFGKYDANRPERGSRVIDQNSVCTCPAWFSKPVEVDSH